MQIHQYDVETVLLHFLKGLEAVVCDCDFMFVLFEDFHRELLVDFVVFCKQDIQGARGVGDGCCRSTFQSGDESVAQVDC